MSRSLKICTLLSHDISQRVVTTDTAITGSHGPRDRQRQMPALLSHHHISEMAFHNYSLLLSAAKSGNVPVSLALCSCPAQLENGRTSCHEMWCWEVLHVKEQDNQVQQTLTKVFSQLNRYACFGLIAYVYI
jgi:hypothetical protein